MISSPSGPCTTLTPGVSVSRSSNLRPRIGIDSIVAWFRVVAAAERDVSTTRVPVVTVTVSETPDTFIAAGRVTVWPTFSEMFS